MRFDLLNQSVDYIVIGIVFIMFIIGSILVLDDIRKRIYRSNFYYRKYKEKISSKLFRRKVDRGFNVEIPFIERIRDDLRELIQRSPYRIVLYSSVFLILFLYSQSKIMFSQTFINCFAIISVFTFIDFLTKYFIFIVEKGFFNNFILDSLYAIFYIVMFALLCFSGLLKLIGEGESINFIAVLIILSIILIPLNQFAKACIDVQNKNFNMGIIILILLVFETIMYLIFGAYNISIDNRYTTINADQLLLGTLQIIQAGTEHIFEYPKLPARIEYTIQYLIGFFVHVIMFGYYISIVSSKALNVDKFKAEN